MDQSHVVTLDDVRYLVSRFEAMAYVLEKEFDNLCEPDRRTIERIAHLAGSAAEAATAALDALELLGDDEPARASNQPCEGRATGDNRPS